MPAEFLIEDDYPRLVLANCHIPDTPKARQLHQWVQEGSVLVPGTYEVLDQVVPQPIPGLRTDTRGRLKEDDTPMIRGTQCVAKVIFDATV